MSAILASKEIQTSSVLSRINQQPSLHAKAPIPSLMGIEGLQVINAREDFSLLKLNYVALGMLVKFQTISYQRSYSQLCTGGTTIRINLLFYSLGEQKQYNINIINFRFKLRVISSKLDQKTMKKVQVTENSMKILQNQQRYLMEMTKKQNNQTKHKITMKISYYDIFIQKHKF